MKMMLASLILLCTFNTLSGQVLLLDVDQAVDKALANNLDLKSERLNLKIKNAPRTPFGTSLYRLQRAVLRFTDPTKNRRILQHLELHRPVGSFRSA